MQNICNILFLNVIWTRFLEMYTHNESPRDRWKSKGRETGKISPAKEQKAAARAGEGGGDEEISAKTNQSGPDNGFHEGVLTLGQLFPWPAPSAQRLQKRHR